MVLWIFFIMTDVSNLDTKLDGHFKLSFVMANVDNLHAIMGRSH
jgi:hypothetical protein